MEATLPQNQPTAAPTGPASLGLDPVAHTLTQAIAIKENGGKLPDMSNLQAGQSGEMKSIFQYTPDTWKAVAGKYLGNPNTPITPEAETQATYMRVQDWLKQGYSPAQIASMHNAGQGEPNAYTGQFSTGKPSVGTNEYGVKYNVPAYAQGVQKIAEQLYNNTYQPPEDPSVAGFAGNVIKSGANFVGNLGNALLHPIQTIQGIGSAAVGGLQEAGGQQNQNTQSFDNLVGYFKDRYGSPDALLHTVYSDPVGLAGDLAAAFGVAGGAAGAVGKAGELSTAADAGRAGEIANATGLRTMAQDTASGNALTRGASTAQTALNTASDLTNPLTPIIAGAGKLLGKSGLVTSELSSQLTGFEPNTIDSIIAHPDEFTPEQIANTTRTAVAKQVESVLQDKIDQLAETGKGYEPFKETPTPLKVAPDFLENQLRNVVKVDVKDGKIIPNSASLVRDKAGINELQHIFNTYKPDFQNGTMNSQKFLNLREDLAGTADYQKALTKNVQEAARSMRSGLNDAYRTQVPGLDAHDASYSAQREELKTLRKGFLDKDGNLLDSAINKIANAGKNKPDTLKRLEQLIPGISKKLDVLKAIEDIQKAGGTKVGTYPSAFLKAGGVIAGAASGNLPLIAASAATMIIASPGIAVPLLRLFGNDKGFASAVTAHLAKYVTLGTVGNRAVNGSSDTAPQTLPNTPATTGAPPQTESIGSAAPTPSPLNSDVSSPEPTPVQ